MAFQYRQISSRKGGGEGGATVLPSQFSLKSNLITTNSLRVSTKITRECRSVRGKQLANVSLDYLGKGVGGGFSLLSGGGCEDNNV